MKENKISFIYCVNDNIKFNESKEYINNLLIPQGFEIEICKIENAKSITEGYNEGMKQTDAKYKIFLHQDVFIINKNFISDFLPIFLKYPEVGMMGVVGSKKLPSNAIWWESNCKFGKIYENHTGKMKLLSFDEPINDYENVQAIDGVIMITQYDIPWREDIFKGWHYYDLSQSVEFNKHGYQVVIPKQEKPWCIHDCGIVNLDGFQKYQEIFLENYQEVI